jgi:hypothetical protein
MRNPDVWQIVRTNPRLAAIKSFVERFTPRIYSTVKEARDTNAPRAVAQAVVAPPVYLAELYGVSVSRLTSAKAQRILGWRPLVSLHDGQAAAREWLQDIGLLHAREPVTRSALPGDGKQSAAAPSLASQ